METIRSTHTLCNGITIDTTIESYEHGLPQEALDQYHTIVQAAAAQAPEALTSLDLFVETYSNNPYALCFALETYEHLNQDEKALAIREKARIAFPEELLVRSQYAMHLMHTGNFEAIPAVFDHKHSLTELYTSNTTISLRALLDWTYVFSSYYAYIQQFDTAHQYVAMLHTLCPHHPVGNNLADIINGVHKITDPTHITSPDESHILEPKHELCNTIRINTDIGTYFDALPADTTELVKRIMKCAGEKSMEAIEPTEQLLKMHPWHSTVAALAASVYQRLSMSEIAGNILRKAQMRDPENLLLRALTARWYTSNGQAQLVPNLFKKSLSLNGLYPKETILTLLEVSEWAFTLGSYFIMGNNIQIATAYAQVLQEICPELPVTHALTEMICKATGCTCEEPVEERPRILKRGGCC